MGRVRVGSKGREGGKERRREQSRREQRREAIWTRYNNIAVLTVTQFGLFIKFKRTNSNWHLYRYCKLRGQFNVFDAFTPLAH